MGFLQGLTTQPVLRLLWAILFSMGTSSELFTLRPAVHVCCKMFAHGQESSVDADDC